MFPSPIGELHFSMNLAAEVKKLREEVSVPYRGATFLNEMREHLKISRAEFSFPSPIGELHFSIVTCKLANKTFSKFPSPIGELHFSII